MHQLAQVRQGRVALAHPLQDAVLPEGQRDLLLLQQLDLHSVHARDREEQHLGGRDLWRHGKVSLAVREEWCHRPRARSAGVDSI